MTFLTKMALFSFVLVTVAVRFNEVDELDLSGETVEKEHEVAKTGKTRVIYGILVEYTSPKTTSLLESEGPVVYGIYSSNVSKYQPMLKAQFDTWAKDVPRPDIVVSGSPKDDHIEGLTSIPLNCNDHPADQPCKEGTLLFRAKERMKKQNADWFVSATEDKYIWTKEVEQALSRFDPNKPVVFARKGCGMRRKSPAYIGCSEVYDNGGICGGTTYIMSRGALNALILEGQTYEDFMQEYLENVGGAHASDIVTSCLLYKRKIPMIGQQGITDRTSHLFEVEGASDEVATDHELQAARKQIGKNAFIAHMVMGGKEQQIAKFMHAFYNEGKHA